MSNPSKPDTGGNGGTRTSPIPKPRPEPKLSMSVTPGEQSDQVSPMSPVIPDADDQQAGKTESPPPVIIPQPTVSEVSAAVREVLPEDLFDEPQPTVSTDDPHAPFVPGHVHFNANPVSAISSDADPDTGSTSSPSIVQTDGASAFPSKNGPGAGALSVLDQLTEQSKEPTPGPFTKSRTSSTTKATTNADATTIQSGSDTTSLKARLLSLFHMPSGRRPSRSRSWPGEGDGDTRLHNHHHHHHHHHHRRWSIPASFESLRRHIRKGKSPEADDGQEKKKK